MAVPQKITFLGSPSLSYITGKSPQRYFKDVVREVWSKYKDDVLVNVWNNILYLEGYFVPGKVFW